MYSLVLMTAMAAGPEAPQFNGYFRDLFSRNSCSGCSGCSGCTGAVRYSCNGGCSGADAYATGSLSSCSGCCGGSSCNGCCGGGPMFPRLRALFSFGGGSCNGCCGGGCYGSCTGQSYACFGCGGGSGCCGGGIIDGGAIPYTPMMNAGPAAPGGFLPSAPPPVFDTIPPAAVPSSPPGGERIPYSQPEAAPSASAIGSNGVVRSAGQPAAGNGRATVLVRLPADAKLFAEGRLLSQKAGERQFVTPELPTGQEFQYKFRVEYDRDGETISVAKRVVVKAGGTVTLEFSDLSAKARPQPADRTASNPVTPAVASQPVAKAEPAKDEPATLPAATPAADGPTGRRAEITVKLPAGAKLYVDDRKSPAADEVTQFATPVLPDGREFAYLLKAEVVRDGRPEYQIQKVSFRAGDRLTIDFTSMAGR